MYEVIAAFCDGEYGQPFPPSQGGWSYKPGEVYPKGGFKPTAAHLAYLLSNETSIGAPLIRERAAKADKPRESKKDVSK